MHVRRVLACSFYHHRHAQPFCSSSPATSSYLTTLNTHGALPPVLLGSPNNAQMVSVEAGTRHYFCVLHEQEGKPAVFRRILCVCVCVRYRFSTVGTVEEMHPCSAFPSSKVVSNLAVRNFFLFKHSSTINGHWNNSYPFLGIVFISFHLRKGSFHGTARIR